MVKTETKEVRRDEAAKKEEEKEEDTAPIRQVSRIHCWI